MDREELETLIAHCDQFQAEADEWKSAIRELMAGLRTIGKSINKRNIEDGKRALSRMADQGEPLVQHVNNAVAGFKAGFDFIRSVAEAELETLNSEF